MGHLIHHSSSENLNKREVGDIWTMTLQEYLKDSPLQRFFYRLLRNLFLLFTTVPLYFFIFAQQFPSLKSPLRKKVSVWLTNLVLVFMIIFMGSIF